MLVRCASLLHGLPQLWSGVTSISKMAGYIPLKPPPLCPPRYLMLAWPVGLWYPARSPGPVRVMPPGWYPQNRAAAPAGLSPPDQTGLRPRSPPLRAASGVSVGPWEKAWPWRWCSWWGRSLWAGGCRCDWSAWRSFSCGWDCGMCCGWVAVRSGLSSLVLRVSLLPLEVPTMPLPGGAPSPFCGCSWTNCASLQDNKNTAHQHTVGHHIEMFCSSRF